MLFFMGSSAHMGNGLIGDASTIGIAAILIVIAALEVNSIVGKQGPMTSVRGVIGSGVGLTAVLYGLMAVL